MPGRSARALVVELVADVADFVKGTQKADDALSDFVRGADQDLGKLEDSADDAARGVNRSLDKIAKDDPFEKIGTQAKEASKEAERAFDNLQREARKSFDKIGDAADDAGHDIGKESFKEAGKESGQEFTTNLGTAVASGDYSTIGTDSAAALAGAFAAFPGFGAAFAPLALAATSVFASMQEQARRAAAQVALAFDTASSAAFENLNQTLRGSSWTQLLEDLGGGDAAKGVKEINKAFEGTNITFQDIQSAYVKGGKSLDQILAKAKNITKESEHHATTAHSGAKEYDAQAKKIQTVTTNLQSANTALGQGVNLAGQVNSVMTSADAARAVDERKQAFRQQAKDMNSIAQSQDRINGGFTDPRINRAIAERTRLLQSQESAARQAAAAVRGAPGTVVGGHRLAN